MNLKKGDKIKYVGFYTYILGCTHGIKMEHGDEAIVCCDLSVDGNKFQKIVEKPKAKADKEDSK